MFAGPRSVEGEGAATAGPPLSAAGPLRSGGTSYPGFVYEFWGDDRRCLYVGKAGAGPSGPGMRIQAHYLNRAPWALAATTIKVTPFPGISDDTLLEVERKRIEALQPRGNKVHNWSRHDDAWMRRTRLAHNRANGLQVSNVDVLVVWWVTVRAWARQLARVVVQALVVDAVLIALVAVLVAALR